MTNCARYEECGREAYMRDPESGEQLCIPHLKGGLGEPTSTPAPRKRAAAKKTAKRAASSGTASRTPTQTTEAAGQTTEAGGEVTS